MMNIFKCHDVHNLKYKSAIWERFRIPYFVCLLYGAFSCIQHTEEIFTDRLLFHENQSLDVVFHQNTAESESTSLNNVLSIQGRKGCAMQKCLRHQIERGGQTQHPLAVMDMTYITDRKAAYRNDLW